MRNTYIYLTLIVLCGCFLVSCEKDDLYGEVAKQSENWNYTEVDGGVRLIEYVGEIKQTIEIPAEINGKAVVEIKGNDQLRKGVFNQDASNVNNIVKSIQINSKLRKLGEFAFSYCTKLEQFTGLEKVGNIGRGTFMGSAMLQIDGQSFSQEINYIGSGAFDGCVNIAETIDLSNRGDLSIGPNAFAECIKLERIELQGTNVTLDLSAVEGTQVPVSSLIAYLSLKEIPEGFLENNKDLEQLDLSDWPLEIIGQNAFKGSAIKQIILPETVNFISTSAFANSALESIDLSKTKIEILFGGRDAVFKDCKNLKSILLPQTLSSMPYTTAGCALSGCSALESLDISMLKNEVIGSGYFRNCTSLKSIIFSSDVKQIQGYLFYFSGNTLEEITIQRAILGDLTKLLSGAFSYKNTGFTRVNYPAGTNYPNEPIWTDLTATGVQFNPIP